MKQHAIHLEMIKHVAERGDYLASHGMEDIINFINGRAEVIEDIKSSKPDLREFVVESLQGFLEDEIFSKPCRGIYSLIRQAKGGDQSFWGELIKLLHLAAVNKVICSGKERILYIIDFGPKWGGMRRSTPYAFTEQGVAMLSSVFRSKRTITL